MSHAKWYYSLRCKGGNRYHPSNSCRNYDARQVTLGETSDCDVRYEAGEYAPEAYATIIRNDDGESWRIVKRSGHVSVTLDGQGDIGYGRQLHDGDIIHIEGQPMALLFEVHHDDKFAQQASPSHSWLWCSLAALIFCAAALLPHLLQGNRISEEDVVSLESSICSLRVDSVQRLLVVGEREEIIATKVLDDNAPCGTAFLTADSLLVSARHCVEYWLGTYLDLTTCVSDLDSNDIVRWAIETETFNQQCQEGSDSTMQLRVFFSIFDHDGKKIDSYASTDSRVHINRNHDSVFLIGDYSQEWYWRSIRPYFTDTEMTRGDIVWIDGQDRCGQIELADSLALRHLHRGTRLMVCGYPLTGLSDKQVTYAEGRIVRKPRAEQENLFFESNINHGFSGGPVMAKVDGKIVAIGLVSRVDSVSSGLYKWAVPVTEIKKGGRP